MLQIVSILFVMLAFTAALVRPPIALALLLAMFPLEQVLQANNPLFISNSSAFNVLCGGMGLVAVLSHWIRKPDLLVGSINPISICTFGIFLFATLSLLWTQSPAWAAETVRDGAPYAVLLLLLAPLLVTDLDGLYAFAKASLVLMLLIAFQLLLNPNFELYTARLVLSLDAANRSNPLVIGTMGGTMMIVAALLQSEKSLRWTLLRFTAAFVGFGIALLSGSRGQVLFALVVAIVFFPMSRQLADVRRFLGAAFGGLGLLGAVYLGAKFFISADNELRWTSESLFYGGTGRIENAVDLLYAWISKPVYLLTGLGYFSFEAIPNRSGDGYSHVMIADALGELGLVGFTLYALFYLFAIRTFMRLFARHRDNPILRSLVATLAALFAFSFLLQNKQGTLFGVDSSWVIGLLIARVEVRERIFGHASADRLDEDSDQGTDPETESFMPEAGLR